MSLFLVRAHDLTRLHTQCAKVLRDSPLASPFDAETIVIADPAITRWLGLKLADSLGIHCNVQYVTPTTWLRHAMQQTMADIPKHDPLHHQRLPWLIFSLLPACLNDASFAPLQVYLADDVHGVKRWQLACRIAYVFDRYQDYRPDWIRQWSLSAEDHWQAVLWRALLADVGQNNHRVAWMDAWLRQIKTHDVKDAPSNNRVCWFGVEQLPPWWDKTLHALSAHRDVFLFQWHVPTSDHPLAQAWGQSVLTHAATDAPSSRPSATLLGQLQQAIYEPNSQQPAPPPTADYSLQLHSCHTPMREVEVLHDTLLAMLDADTSLRAEDILVLLPDISRYATYIDVVFAEQTGCPFIPWNISDVYRVDEHPIVEIFFQLLALPESRFAQSAINAYLDVEEITQHFSLDDEQLLIIRNMLAELEVRWGVDAAHRASFDLPRWQEQSWQAAFNRLFAGYALGSDEVWKSIIPTPIDTNTATAMATFFALFEVLNDWRTRLNTSQTGQQWQMALSQMIDDVFGEGEATTGKVDVLRAAIDGLARHAGHALLHIAVVRQFLKETLQSSQQHARYFSGGVSFCAMRPMRPLPFRVIALLGMNDAIFPRRDAPYEFDLMAIAPQPSDPNHGTTDRYSMLQTVLSAKDILYISYCGRSIKNNTPCQPSVLVSELLDVLPQGSDLAIAEQITTQHPMQPFDAKNYTEGHASYNHPWARIAETIMEDSDHATITSWRNHQLDTKDFGNNTLPLSRLIRFVCDPVKFFFNERLAVRVQPLEASTDDELFSLDSLQAWQVRQRLLEYTQAGETLNAARLASEGLLPHGAFSTQQLHQEAEAIEEVQKNVQEYAQVKTAPQRISLPLHGIDGTTITLIGQLTAYYPEKGLMHYTASSYKSKPALRLWLEHLAWCASNTYPCGEQTTLLCRDTKKIITRVTQEEACHLLHGFISAMQAGLRRPLPIFPYASWAWANTMHKKNDDAAALRAAKNAWYSGGYNIADEADAYVQLAMRGVEGIPMDSEEFTPWAAQWYTALLEHTVDA